MRYDTLQNIYLVIGRISDHINEANPLNPRHAHPGHMWEMDVYPGQKYNNVDHRDTGHADIWDKGIKFNRI